MSFVIRQFVSDHDAVEDIYQETFRLVLEKLRDGAVREPERLSGFITSIARNLVVEQFRRVSRRRAREEPEADQPVASPASSQLDGLLREEKNLHHIFRYVRGAMPVAERAAFEAHFLDCPECLEQLEAASSLRDAIRMAAAELAPSAEATGNILATSWLRLLFAWRWVPLSATACPVAVSLTGVFLYRQLEQARNELGRTQLAYARELESSRALLQSPERNSPLF